MENSNASPKDIKTGKRLIVDLDNTITVTIKGDYVHSMAVQETIDLLKQYKKEGFEIVIFQVVI